VVDENKQEKTWSPSYLREPQLLLRATAFHEAGHAVVGYRYGKFVRDNGIRIDFIRPGLGNCHTRGEYLFPLQQVGDSMMRGAQVKRLRSECIESLAGHAAEFRAMAIRKWVTLECPDTRRALELIKSVRECGEQTAMLELEWTYVPATRRMVRDQAIWQGIETVAKELLKADGFLSSDKANSILENTGVIQVSPTYWR